MAALLLLGVAVPLAMAIAAGAIGVLSDDEWVYALGADSLYRTGAITMPGHTAAAVGQIVLVQPLLWLSGGASWAYSAFGLAMAALGLVATYLLARQYLGWAAAGTVALLVVCFPGFARQSAGFMTDVPAFALTMLSLLLGVRWLRHGRRADLVASLVVGVVAVSIREFALAVIVAVLATAWARSRPGERGLLLLLSILTAGSVAALLVAVRSPAVNGGIASPDPIHLYLMGPALVTLAAVLLPAAIPAVSRRLGTLSPLHLLSGIGLVVIAFVVPTTGPLVGQFWMADGLVGNYLLSGTRQPVIGPVAWGLSEALALLAAALIAMLTARWALRRLAGARTLPTVRARLVETARLPAAPLLLFLLVYAAEIGVIVWMRSYPLDRYLYPMVPVAAILLLRETAGRERPLSRPLGCAAIAWLGASALLITTNSFAYDAARWRAGEAAVASGYQPSTVDAGYDWVGFHAGTHLSTSGPSLGMTWYDDMFMTAPPCAVVSNSPLDKPGFTLIREDPSAYRQYLLAGPDQPLYVYGSTAAGCPALPAP
jgi:hypothetical protein